MRIWRVEYFWLLLVVCVLVLAVWWLPGGGSLNTDSYSVAFAGKKALYQSLRRLEPDVSRSSEQLVPRPGIADRLLILGPARAPSADEWSELYLAVHGGASLLYAASARDPHLEADLFGAQVVPNESKVLPGSSADDEDSPAGQSQDAENLEHEKQQGENQAEQKPDDTKKNFASLFQKDFVAETELVEGDVAWKVRAGLELDDPDWEVLVSADSKPQVARLRVGSGTVVLVASDDIFSNQALTDPNRALLAYRIIESLPNPGQTWLDESLNSSGVPKVLGILFDPEFRPLTLQLILIVVLFGWSGSRRFGPAEPRPEPRRRSIVEHVEALGILYFRARAGAHAVSSQREYLKLELRQLFGTNFRDENAEALSRRAGLDEQEVRALFRAADVSPDSPMSNPVAGRLLLRLAELSARVKVNSGQRPT